MVDLGKDVAKYLLIATIMLIVIFGVIKPALRPLMVKPEPAEKEDAAHKEGEAGGIDVTEGEDFTQTDEAIPHQPAVQPYEQGLQAAKQIAQDDPRIVASVIKDWVNGNE